MANHTLDSGSNHFQKVLACINGLMATNIKGNGLRMYDMAMALTFSLMEISTMVSIKTA